MSGLVGKEHTSVQYIIMYFFFSFLTVTVSASRVKSEDVAASVSVVVVVVFVVVVIFVVAVLRANESADRGHNIKRLSIQSVTDRIESPLNICFK